MVFSGRISRLSGIRLKIRNLIVEPVKGGVAVETALDLTPHPEFNSKRQDVPAQKQQQPEGGLSTLMILDQAAKMKPPCHQLALRTAVVAM
jgi:hypothetical protein